jgi:hypothetical protein
MLEQEQGNKNAPPTQFARTAGSKITRPPDLFHEQHEDWLKRGVEYFLDEAIAAGEEKLSALKSWFPTLVADFFLLKAWKQPTDPRQEFLWARQLARIDAAEVETRDAFEHVFDHPPLDRRGEKLKARPDFLDAIRSRILHVRRMDAERGTRTAQSAALSAQHVPEVASNATWRALRQQAKERRNRDELPEEASHDESN